MRIYRMISFFILIFTFGLFRSLVLSADISVSCTSGRCSPDTVSGLFPGTVNWIPGQSIEKTIQVENTTGMKQSVGLRTQNVIVSGSVDSVLMMTIRQLNGALTIYTGTLETFLLTPSFTLDTLDSAKNETYIFTISMPSSVGNQYQSKSAAFDMLLSLTEIQPVADNSKNGGSSTTSTTSTGTGTTGQSTGGSQVLGLTTFGQSEDISGEDTTVLGESTFSGVLVPTQAVGELLGTENRNTYLRIMIIFIGTFGVILSFVAWITWKRFIRGSTI